MKTQESFFDFEEIIAGFTKRQKRIYVPNFDEWGLHFKSKSNGSTKKVKAIKEKRLSSINFQKAKKYSYSHNFREEDEKKEAKYLLPEEYHQENEYWALSDGNGEIKSPQEVFLEQVRKTKRKGGANPKFENSHWEAVINLNSHHTMEDLHKLRKHIESKYKFICCAMTIHRDEGALIEIKGEKIPKYNYHAHLNFITYANGGQQFRLNKRQLSEIQSEVAEVLGMERGKEFSKAKRLAHQHYRYVKEQENKLKGENELVLQQNTELQEQNQTLAAKNQELELELTNQSKRKAFWRKKRQEMIQEGGYTQQDYQFIRAIVMDSENNYESVIKAIEDYKELKSTNKTQKPLTEEQIQEIEKPLKEKIIQKEQDLALEKQKSSETIQNLTQELKTLKIENESLKSQEPALTYEQKEKIKSEKLEQELKEARANAYPQEPKLQVQIKEVIKEVQKPLTEEQKQEIIAPYKDKISSLEDIIQGFHNLLVKLGLKREDSEIERIPTLPRMSPQTRQDLQRTIKRALSNANNGMER